VSTTFHYIPNAAALAEAKTSLEAELTEAASSAQYSCPGTQPGPRGDAHEMRNAQIRGQAMSTYLVSRLNTTIPLTLASLRTYYKAHVSQYDTICISIALVAPAQVSAFSAAEAKGESVAALAKQFSSDASAKKGGAYGCFAPRARL